MALRGGGGASSERVAERGAFFTRANLHHPMHQGAFWHNLFYKLVNENDDASLVCSLTCDSRDLKVEHAARFPASIERVAERGTLFIFVLVFGTASGIGCYTSLLELESCNCLHKLSTNKIFSTARQHSILIGPKFGKLVTH